MEKLLIIGGPNFIGRVLLEELEKLNRYQVTLFNRGLTNPELFPNVRRIKGDRNTGDVQQLATQKWDYVIDIACYLPGNFPKLLQAINKDVKKYLFVSTVSVYKDAEGSNPDEASPTWKYEATVDVDQPINSATLYGPRKAECERILQASGLNHVILRPAIIYGDYDVTDRTGYWLYQVKKKNTLFVPETGSNKVSHTYVRDLVKTMLLLLSPEGNGEVYNSITNHFSIAQLVALAKDALNVNPMVLTAPKDFLDNENLTYWTDLPLWLEHDAIWDNERYNTRFGGHFTPIPQSIAEAVAYYESVGWPEPAYRKLKDERYDAVVGRLIKTKKNV